MPPPDADYSQPPPQYNSMQQQAGLLPALAIPPPVVFPGQISAMLASGGPGAAMGALPQMFPGNTYQTMTGAPPMYQGPTGVMQPQMPSAPYNPYPGPNPYAGLGQAGPPSLFAPNYPAPPPFYAGPQGSGVTPFGPMAPPSMFDTPYGAALAQRQAADDRGFTNNTAAMGMGARVGVSGMAGLAGAALGARFGGGWGAAIGGAVGYMGAEFSGLSQAGQNAFMNFGMGPSIQQRALAGGIEHASQHFMPFGSSLHAGGAGFSHHAASAAASGLMEMGNSASFRRETFDRFNTQDLAKITQTSAHTGMLSGVNDAEGMVSRVRDIAKSVNAFMELAKEPDIQRAIHTMGSLRASGLNLSETLGAVQSGRAFARMAGSSFQEMAEMGGGVGSATFQSMGLSQGLGFRTGMANMGIASASQNAGFLSPQMMSLVGGAQGLGNLNNMFSAGMLQMPMLAPGMMTANGGLNQGALANLMSGRSDLFSMTGRGSNMLTQMTNRSGIEGLGMATAMQPMLQDQIGRLMAAQGPFAQRNMEDTQIANLSRQMNMRGSAGFMTAAQSMGMSPSQALARAQELSSPGYFAGQRQQLGVQFRESRMAADRRREADEPTLAGTLRRTTFVGDVADRFNDAWEDHAQPLAHFFGGDHTRSGNIYTPSTDMARRRMSRVAGSQSYLNYAREATRGASTEEMERGFFDRLRDTRVLAQARGGVGPTALASSLLMARGRRDLDGPLNIGMSDSEIRAEARGLAQAGRFSQSLLIGNQAEERSAARSLGSTFGTGAAGRDALVNFSQSIANMRPNAGMGTQLAAGAGTNMLLRAGTMAVTNGVLDPGNMVGQGANMANQYRDAFVNSMVRSGAATRERATEIFAQHGERIVTQASPMARLTMTAEDRARLRQTMDLGRRVGRRGGSTLSNARTEEGEAYGRILGDRHDRSQYNAFMDNVEGVGREGSARYERSRYIISSLAMASGVAQHAGPENRDAARATVQRILQQAGREGFSQEEVNNLARRAQGLSGRFQEGEGQRTALAFVRNAGSERTGRGILDRFQTADQNRIQAQTLQNSAAGFADLGRGSGILGRAFSGMTAESFSQEDAEQRLQNMGREDLTALSREGGFGRLMAREIRAFQQGDTRALRRVNELMQRRGNRQTDLLRQYEERHSGGIGTANWWKDALRSQRGQDSDRERWINDQMSASSEAEFSDRRQMDESLATESEMRRSGIGTTGDAAGRGGDTLLDASRELREVTRNLRDVLQGGSLDNLITGPGGNSP